MRKWRCIIGLLVLCAPVWGYAADQNLFFLSGKDTPQIEGDMYNRAIYYIAVPPDLSTAIYLRMFDADLGGNHDRSEPGAEARYRVYGKGALDWTLQKLTDPLPAQPPLAELALRENKTYDNQWRTLATLTPDTAEPQGNISYFQLLVDGISGYAVNKYQIFVSSQEKENAAIEGVQILSPTVMLYMPAAAGFSTQLQFRIPADAQYLEIFNFDADLQQKKATFYFETQFTQAIPIASSKDGQITSTQIEIPLAERGHTGALVLQNPKETNQIQFWITDDHGRPVMVALPTFTGPDNHLPVADFTAMPLTECLSVVLDASASSDPDQDELNFTWMFPDGTQAQGRRIVRQFEAAGTYPVTLIASDTSGFVANSSQVTRAIQINQPPVAVITAPDRAALNEQFTLDASASQDADGAILKYLWNFGDGAKADGPTQTHRYARSGKYQVTLVVEDDSQSLCSQGRTTQWIAVNAAPVPRLNVTPIAAIGETVPLTAEGSIDSDGEIQSYVWDFGDGATGEGDTVTHAWTQPGTYTVRLKVTDGAGVKNSSATDQAEIVINAPPIPRAAYRAVIAAQEEVNFDGAVSVDPDGSIRQYVWQMGDGATKAGAQIRHAYAEPGTYTITLTVTDNTDTLNNTAATTFQVRVNDPPQPKVGDDRVVNTSVVTFAASASTDQDDQIIAYRWDFGDGVQQEGTSVTHVYALPGTYTVTLTITDDSGTLSASQSDTATITVNHPPVADAGNAQQVAPGERVVLDGSFSEDPDGEITAYQWTVAENATFDDARIEYQYARPGQYLAQLTVTDNDGAEHTDYAVITVNAPPIADFYPLPRLAPGQAVQFDGSPSHDADGTIQQARWDLGDGSPVVEGLTVEHQFAASGRYVVTLTVQDDSGQSNQTATQIRTIEVNYPPQAVTGADIHTCTQYVAFDASSSTDPDGDDLDYTWEFGDGMQGQGRTLAHTYAQPGIYPVRLTVTDGYGLRNSVAYATLTVYVNAPPVAQIQMNSATVCAGELVLFDASPSRDLEKGLLHYRWDLGDGTPVNGINPVREFTEGGDYRIRLWVTDDSGLACNTTATETMLHVIDAPIANAGPDQTVCANTLVQFDGSASTGGGREIKSYEWEFGDGQFGVGAQPGHVYSQPGEYTARLLITVAGDGACTNVSEDEVTIRVMAAPVAAFETQQAACAAETLTFDARASTSAEGQITGFAWDFGDGTSASGLQTTHAYQTPGTYQARLQITTDATSVCRTATTATTITINAVPTPVIQVTTADQPPFSGAAYDADPQAVLRFSGATSVDSDGFVKTYTWDFSDGQQTAGPFAVHQFAAPGEYPVTLQIRDNSATACDMNESTLLVRVRTPAKQTIQGPEQICLNQPFKYVIETPPDTVEWHLNTGVTATGPEFQAAFTTPGTYQLQAKVGVDWLPTKTIAALQLPALRLPERLELYAGDTVDIQPVYNRSTGLPLLFHWDSGDGVIRDTERASLTYAHPGEFTLTFQVTLEGGPECLHADYQIPVIVRAAPQVTIRITPEDLFSGGARDAISFEAVLQAETADWNYTWDFGDGETAIGQYVSHAYRKGGTYNVTVTLADALRRTAQTYRFATQIEVQPR